MWILYLYDLICQKLGVLSPEESSYASFRTVFADQLSAHNLHEGLNFGLFQLEQDEAKLPYIPIYIYVQSRCGKSTTGTLVVIWKEMKSS